MRRQCTLLRRWWWLMNIAYETTQRRVTPIGSSFDILALPRAIRGLELRRILLQYAIFFCDDVISSSWLLVDFLYREYTTLTYFGILLLYVLPTSPPTKGRGWSRQSDYSGTQTGTCGLLCCSASSFRRYMLAPLPSAGDVVVA